MWAETFRETKQQVEVWCPLGQVNETNGAADLKKKKKKGFGLPNLFREKKSHLKSV